MSNTKFQLGDQVMLNSGGPYMTVDRMMNDQVSCTWFHDNDLKVAVFKTQLLRLRSEIEAEHAEGVRRRGERLNRMNHDRYGEY